MDEELIFRASAGAAEPSDPPAGEAEWTAEGANAALRWGKDGGLYSAYGAW